MDTGTSAILIVSLLAGLSCFAFFVGFLVQLRKRARVRMVFGFLAMFVMLLVAVASGAISLGLRGYRSLVSEQLAAVIILEPVAPQRFRAVFQFPDGNENEFDLAGDQIYVDAKILKWKSIGTLLGLDTEYALDRVSGRYQRLEDERSRSRTVQSLSATSFVDLFWLRRRFARLSPLYDVEYGSAAFAPAAEPMTYELRVSASGLLLRPAPQPAPQTGG
jgi:hypothetical protein